MDNFTVDYHISEESKDVPLLKLLLQPLVENAIIHGMEGKSSGGSLVISSRIERGRPWLLAYRITGRGLRKNGALYPA